LSTCADGPIVCCFTRRFGAAAGAASSSLLMVQSMTSAIFRREQRRFGKGQRGDIKIAQLRASFVRNRSDFLQRTARSVYFKRQGLLWRNCGRVRRAAFALLDS